MSLTEETLAGRLWREFPTPRKFLGTDALSWEVDGASSVSPNIFSDTETLKVALVALHRSDARTQIRNNLES